MKDDAPSATANIVAQNIILISNTPALSHLVAPEGARLSSCFVQAFSDNGDKFIRLSEIFSQYFIPGVQIIEKVIPVPVGLNLTLVAEKRGIP